VHSRDEVVASVQATFPKSSWARVLELLDSYGVEPCERERERVQGAILKLSAASEAKVREYVAVAKRDYRDVLFWAEYPKESRLDTPEKRQRVSKVFEKFGIEPPKRYLIYRLREIKAPPPRAPAHSQSGRLRAE